MPVTEEERIYIQEFILSKEKEKEESFDKKLTRWINIMAFVGVTSVGSVIVGVYYLLRGVVIETAKTEVLKELSRDKLLEKQITAVEALITARATIQYANAQSADLVNRSKMLEKDTTEILDQVVKSKRDLEAAQDTIDKFRTINSKSKALVAEIIKDPNFADEVAKKVGLPGQMVVAFNRSKTDGACPPEWRLFAPASGRFVIGAGDAMNTDVNGVPLSAHLSIKDDSAAGVGGEVNHKLTEAQMPPHQHGVYPHAGFVASGGGAPPPSGAIPGAGGGDTYTQVWPGITSVTGGGKPFDIMPPFVALYYCIKE